MIAILNKTWGLVKPPTTKRFNSFQRLSQIQNEIVKRGEVAAWFGRYDEAEKLYLEVDRRDLAISLRKKLGDWFKVGIYLIL